jgi:glutamate 5-kinase
MEFLKENARRVVVKIGTNTLTGAEGRLEMDCLRQICSQVAEVRARGLEVIVVSSGAIGLGIAHLGWRKRPTDLASLQACAAIGQAILMDLWKQCLAPHSLSCAQILLTHEDVRHRHRHLAVRDTLERLLSLGLVPIVNENDTVSAAEIRFGDNDMLSALTASLTKADLLVILSTIPGLLDLCGDGQLVPVVPRITPEIEAMAGGTDSPFATGGMISKIAAAKVSVRSGCGVFIGDGKNPSLLPDLLSGRAEGTFFVPATLSLDAKKRWVAFFGAPDGRILVDAGAGEALRVRGRSLLAKGIVAIKGQFAAGAVVEIADDGGRVFARGLTQFDAEALEAVRGLDSGAIRTRFPQRKRTEVVHRDALVLL